MGEARGVPSLVETVDLHEEDPMDGRAWQDMVLYPVPIDRIAEVRALLAKKPDSRSESTSSSASPEDRINEILTSVAAAG